MSKIEELDKLDRAIKDAEIRLKSIQSSIEQITKEINVLEPRKKELEQNIVFHKKSGTVPIAHEYRKAKSELGKVRARLVLITFDRKKAVEACNQIDEIIAKFKKEHSDILKISDNNVLRVLFGVKRGEE